MLLRTFSLSIKWFLCPLLGYRQIGLNFLCWRDHCEVMCPRGGWHADPNFRKIVCSYWAFKWCMYLCSCVYCVWCCSNLRWVVINFNITMLHFVYTIMSHAMHTNSIISPIHTNTIELCNVTCTLVVTCGILQNLEGRWVLNGFFLLFLRNTQLSQLVCVTKWSYTML